MEVLTVCTIYLLCSKGVKRLILNWEKCRFIVQQEIVLGHVIYCRGIEVDKAKIDLISNIHPPSTMKVIKSFLKTH
jgi:hypothetical protein